MVVLAARGTPCSQFSGTTLEEAGAVDLWKEEAGRPPDAVGFSFQDLFMLTPGAQFIKSERRHLLSLYKSHRKAARS